MHPIAFIRKNRRSAVTRGRRFCFIRERETMVHLFEKNGFHIVLDVHSGAVHDVDEVAYDVIALYEKKPKEQIKDDALEKFIGCLAGRQTIEGMTTDDALERLKGCAKGAVDKPLTIEEMNEIAAAGWAGEYK